MRNLYLLALLLIGGTFSGSLSGQTCQPPNAIPQPTFNRALCFGVSGDTVNANPSGNSHYTYSWSNSSTSSTIVLTSAGSFSVTVTNTQLNCSAVFTDTIPADPDVSATRIITLICSDTASADLQLDGQGGDSIYTAYDLIGIGTNTTGSFPNLKTGTYTYIITDGLGCTASSTVSIPPGKAQEIFDISYSSGCTQNKTITVTSVNGGGLPFEYELNGGGFSFTDSFTNVAPGTYTIVAKNFASGCTDTLTAVVSPSGSIANPVFRPAICFGLNDTINANPNDSSNLHYVWSNGDTTSYIITGAGPFSVTVTNSQAGCSAVFSDNIVQDGSIHSSNVYDLHLCSSPPYGNATLVAEGGTAPYVYYLFGIDTNTTGNFPNLAPNNYSFAIQDSFGCVIDENFSIPQGAASATFNIEVTPATCSTVADGEIIISPTTTQVGFLQYSLNGGPSQLDTAFNNIAAGSYTITITNIVSGCSYDTSATVTAPTGYTAIVTPDSINAGPGTKDTLSVTSTTFPNPAYLWYPSTGLSCDTCASPTVIIDSSMNGKYYYVQVYTAGDSACYTLDSVLIRSQIPVLFAMPSAFSPNGDGHDDFFGPASVMNSFASPTVKAFRIYNRWGQLVFNSSAPNATWDGKFKGEEQPVGTYAYYIEVQYTNPDTGTTVTNKQQGSVTLLR